MSPHHRVLVVAGRTTWGTTWGTTYTLDAWMMHVLLPYSEFTIGELPPATHDHLKKNLQTFLFFILKNKYIGKKHYFSQKISFIFKLN